MNAYASAALGPASLAYPTMEQVSQSSPSRRLEWARFLPQPKTVDESGVLKQIERSGGRTGLARRWDQFPAW